MALSLELIGGSSYLWRWKHGVFHHTYVNVMSHDTDIELAPLARLAPHQKRLAIHRWQHLYMWPLYGLLTIKWQCLDDFRKLLQRADQRASRPTAQGLGAGDLHRRQGSLLHARLRDPAAVPSPAVVLGYYVLSGTRHGVPAERGVPGGALRRGGRVPRARPDHRSHRSRVGGPSGPDERDFRPARAGSCRGSSAGSISRSSTICSPGSATSTTRRSRAWWKQTCREFGIRYTAHRSFRAGIASHFRWLRRMGMPDGADAGLGRDVLRPRTP